MKTSYILYLWDTSDTHQAIARFSSDSPFHTFQAGDRFDDTGWVRLGGIGVIASATRPIRYTVHSIKHLIEEKNSELFIHYCVNLEPFSGPPSPVWSEPAKEDGEIQEEPKTKARPFPPLLSSFPSVESNLQSAIKTT